MVIEHVTVPRGHGSHGRGDRDVDSRGGGSRHDGP